jgi:hypothetical protein
MGQKVVTAAQDATPAIGGGAQGSIVGVNLKDATGAFVGTITFEGLIGGNWVAIGAEPFAGGALVTTATANGSWRIRTAGTEGVRAAYTHTSRRADSMTTTSSADGAVTRGALRLRRPARPLCKLHARRPGDRRRRCPTRAGTVFLTEAQPEVHSDLFTRYPDLAYGAPLLLTSADGGFTYTFGLDAAGDAIRPMGHAEIYPNLRAIPDSPLIIGEDYLFEGSLIRTLGNRAKTWANGPYARLVIRPDAAIDAATQPVLAPSRRGCSTSGRRSRRGRHGPARGPTLPTTPPSTRISR